MGKLEDPSQFDYADARAFSKNIKVGIGADGTQRRAIKQYNDHIRKNLAHRAAGRAAKLAARASFAAVTKKCGKLLGKALTFGFFALDTSAGGIDYAIHEATWPVSELINGPSQFELEEIEKQLDLEYPLDAPPDLPPGVYTRGEGF